MEIKIPTQADYLKILKSLQGSGYASDDDSARVKELTSVAAIAATATKALALATRNAFVSHAVELLSDWERVRGAPSARGLSDDSRRARLVAFGKALPKLVRARLSAASLAYTGNAGTTTRITSASGIGGPRYWGFGIGRLQPGATEAQLRTIDSILERAPARYIGKKSGTAYATYGTTLERKVISPTPVVSVVTNNTPHVAPVEVFPGAAVTREAWREIQAQLMYQPESLGDPSSPMTIDNALPGEWVYFAGRINNSTLATLEASGAATFSGGRAASAWGAFATAAPSDWSTVTASQRLWLPLSRIAVGEPAKPILTLAGTPSGLTFQISATGRPQIQNATGAAQDFILLVRTTPGIARDGVHDNAPWAPDFDVITNASVAALHSGNTFRAWLSGGAAWTPVTSPGAGVGSIRRILYTGLMRAGDSVVMDSSVDWRNRVLLVSNVTQGNDGTTPPSPSAQILPGLTFQDNPYAVPKLFLTSTGSVVGAASSRKLSDVPVLPAIRIFADQGNGALMAELPTGATGGTAASGFFLITASDFAETDDPAPLHATQVHAYDLALIQNRGVYAQGTQGGAPRKFPSDAPRAALTTPPLGLISESTSPRRPASFMVRERIGNAADDVYEVRQRIIGQRRRIVTARIISGNAIAIDPLDSPDLCDYRDRYVWIDGRLMYSDGRLSGTGADDDSSRVPISMAFYTGPYGDQTFEILPDISIRFVYSRAAISTGMRSTILLSNANAFDVYLNLVIETTGYLGLADLRNYGATP